MRDRIYIKDVLEAGYCVKGQKTWFKFRGLSFRDYVRNGIAVSEALKYDDDAMVESIMKVLEREDGQEG